MSSDTVWVTNDQHRSFSQDYDLIDNDIYKDFRLEFGTLYRCKRKYDGKLFGVKVIFKKKLHEMYNSSKEIKQILIKAIKHEIDTLQHLKHKYIVNVHEIYETETALYIIVDECIGGQLYTKLYQQHRINEFQCKHIIKQICTVLYYLNSKYLIIHCDLNINNIYFVDPSMNYIKIDNFCMSQILPHLPSKVSSKQMVTSYTAPECINNRDNYSHYSDMWALGVITFIILFGFEPFISRSNDNNELSKIIRKGFQNKIKVNSFQIQQRHIKNTTSHLFLFAFYDLIKCNYK